MQELHNTQLMQQQIGQEIEQSRFQLSSSCVQYVCGFRLLLETVKVLIKSNLKGFLNKYLIFTKGLGENLCLNTIFILTQITKTMQTSKNALT